LLSERKENDHEASRRLKTEFLVQFDGLNNSPTDRISLIGATNLPHYLDPAALRRFVRKGLLVRNVNFTIRGRGYIFRYQMNMQEHR